MRFAVRSILAVIFIALSISYSVMLFVMFGASFSSGLSSHLFFFLSGVMIFAAMWFFTWEKTKFLRVGLHEKAHAFIYSLAGWEINEMRITTNEGGYIHYMMPSRASNRFIDTIGTLAPYCFPYRVILWMMILPLLRPGAYNLYFFLLGAPVSLHLMAAITDFISQSRIREGTDIHIVGFGFSLIVVLFMNILIYGTVLATVLGGWAGTKDFVVFGPWALWWAAGVLWVLGYG